LYEKAYSALDIMSYIQHDMNIEDKRRYASLIYFDKVRKEFRNEILKKCKWTIITPPYFQKQKMNIQQI